MLKTKKYINSSVMLEVSAHGFTPLHLIVLGSYSYQVLDNTEGELKVNKDRVCGGFQTFYLWQADLHIDYQVGVTATLGNIRCITRRYFSCQDQFLCGRMLLLCKTRGNNHVMLSSEKGHGNNNVQLHQRET